MGRRTAGTPAPEGVRESGGRRERRKVCAGYVVTVAGLKAGFVKVKGAVATAKKGELEPTVGVLVFDPVRQDIGVSLLDYSVRMRWGMLELLFASAPNIGRPLDGEGFFEERDGLTYVQAVAMQTPIYAWVNAHFTGAKWGALPRWDLAFAVQLGKVVALVAGVVPGRSQDAGGGA